MLMGSWIMGTVGSPTCHVDCWHQIIDFSLSLQIELLLILSAKSYRSLINTPTYIRPTKAK